MHYQGYIKLKSYVRLFSYGASSGMGKRLSEKLSESGHQVSGNYHKNELHLNNPSIRLYPLYVLDETISLDFLPGTLTGDIYCPAAFICCHLKKLTR
jgi:hypothetical protein